VSDYSGGPGWWQASDGKWYPPPSSGGFNPGQQVPNQPSNPAPQQPYQQTGYPQGNFPGGAQMPVQPKKKGFVPVLIILIVVILLIVGVAVALNKNSSSSPINAAQTFWSGFKNNNQAQACGVVIPQSKSYCNKEFPKLESAINGKVKLNLNVGDDYIDGNQAIVAFTGTLCIAVSTYKQCYSNTDPKKGLPTSNSSFKTDWNNLNSSSSQAQFFDMPMVLISGTWYVSLSSNSSSGSSGSNSGTSGNSGTTTTAGSSGSSGNSGNSGTTTTTAGSSGTSGTSGTNSGTSGNSGQTTTTT
jgi:uncharacterized membrane protein YgcG